MRIASFISIALLSFFSPLGVFALAVFVYACFYEPYEMLIVSVCVDAFFGDANTDALYEYTFVTGCILLLAVFVRPHLRFYNQ